MLNQIVEIATDGVHLSVLRGFLKVSQDGTEIGRVPLPDIGAVIVRGHGASISLNLVARLAQENIPVVLCGSNQTPASVVWPLAGHHEQGQIMEAQAGLSQPQRKRLWQALVQAKIRAQAAALEAIGENAGDLIDLSKKVRSGDPENLEAQAARRYWPRMMKTVDETFTRDTDQSGINSWLNYGYAVLRAGTARSILAAGLHPSLSLHHISRGEALRLTSDLMEPFRPWVDLTVYRLAHGQTQIGSDLDPEQKKEIVRVLSLDLIGPSGASPVQTCLDRLCQSLAQFCLGERKSLEFPKGLALPIGVSGRDRTTEGGAAQ